MHIYTDGSRTEDGRVAAAFYVEDLEYGHTKRLQDNSSVYAAELAGIGMAIDWIERASVSTKIVIFSDSLSAMQSLRSSGTSVRPNTIAALLARIAALDVSLQFVWVPSHVGIRGNDAADELARTGTRRQAVEIHPEQELNEEFAKVDCYVTGLWQQFYANSKTGSFYRDIEPTVSTKIKYRDTCRRKETLITRLRLGKCALNLYLFQISKHDDGFCQTCGEPESTEHLLLECSRSQTTRKILQRCREFNLQPTIKDILSDQRMITVVYDLISALDRKI